MKRLLIAMAVGGAALLGSSAAKAADNTVKAKTATNVTQSTSTDISSRRRYHHYGYRYRPYYRATATLRGRTTAADMVDRTMAAGMDTAARA
jgi:hypothetical protein